MEDRPNYYAIIPAQIRYDERLKPNEKLLYGEITALSNKTGECYATNKCFASLYDVTVETISRWITHLKELNYIDSKIIYRDGTHEIDKRIILINGVPIDKKINTYYNLYAMRISMVLGNGTNLEQTLNRLLLLLKDAGKEEREAVLGAVSGAYRVMEYGYVGRKSLERRKRRNQDAPAPGIVEPVLSEEEREPLSLTPSTRRFT